MCWSTPVRRACPSCALRFRAPAAFHAAPRRPRARRAATRPQNPRGRRRSRGQRSRLHGRQFAALTKDGLSHVPLVAALDAFAIRAARFRRFHLGAHVPAVRTLLSDGLVPAHEITLGIIFAAIERLAALLRFPLGNIAAVLWALHAGRHRFGTAAFRESRTT